MPLQYFCTAPFNICSAQYIKEITMSLIRTLSEQFRRHRAYLEARRELERLTPADLADIGITVWDIDTIAREQAEKVLSTNRRA